MPRKSRLWAFKTEEADWIVNPSNEIAFYDALWGPNSWSQLQKRHTSGFSFCIYSHVVESYCHWVKSQVVWVHYFSVLLTANKLVSLRLTFLTYKKRLVTLPVSPHRCWEDGMGGQKQGTDFSVQQLLVPGTVLSDFLMLSPLSLTLDMIVFKGDFLGHIMWWQS